MSKVSVQDSLNERSSDMALTEWSPISSTRRSRSSVIAGEAAPPQ